MDDDLKRKYDSLVKLYDNGDYEEALEKIEDIDKKDKVPDFFNLEGMILNNIGEYDKAVDKYNIALSFNNLNDKSKAITYNNMGNSYYYKKDYEKAMDYYEKAIELGSKDSYCFIISLYFSIGKYEEVKRYINKGKEVTPNIPLFINNANFFKLSQNPFNDKIIEEVKKEFSRGIKIAKEKKDESINILKRNYQICNILTSDDGYEMENKRVQIEKILEVLDEYYKKYPKPMPSVFISYSHTDADYEEKVLKIALALEFNEIRVVIDKKLLAGDSITKLMEEEIKKHKYSIVLLNETYLSKVQSSKDSGAKTEYEMLQSLEERGKTKIYHIFTDETPIDAFKKSKGFKALEEVNPLCLSFSKPEIENWELPKLFKAIKHDS